jgi:WXXGXW repeat (2 copies)/Domain of unknown function (DUF4124)
VDDVNAGRGFQSYIVSMHTYETTRRRRMFATNLSLRILVGMLCVTAATGIVEAGEIYKSLDANGNVVYSDHIDPSMSQSTAVQLEAPHLAGSNAERDTKNSERPDSSSSGTVSSAATPPPLPEEDQPALSQDGELWTPGYWYWRNQGYFWIPGAWVRPPQVGVLWTPAYWAFAGTVFVFHPGHWGSTVGYYGGVNYGHGYSGNGYTGGHWIGNSFAYNTGAGTRTVSRRQSPSQAVNKPAATTAFQRTAEHAPKPVEVDRPAAVAKMPPPGAPPKFNHVARAPAASVRK